MFTFSATNDILLHVRSHPALFPVHWLPYRRRGSSRPCQPDRSLIVRAGTRPSSSLARKYYTDNHHHAARKVPRVSSSADHPKQVKQHGSSLQINDMGETAIDEETFEEYLTIMRETYTANKVSVRAPVASSLRGRRFLTFQTDGAHEQTSMQ